jgi:hypothetical protein
MVNYILVYKIRKLVKEILKEKIEEGEIATTPRSCLGCLADEIGWEVYYLIKEMQDKKKGSKNSQIEMSERPEEESGEKSKTPLQGKAQNEASPDDKSSELRRQEESQSTEKITDKD